MKIIIDIPEKTNAHIRSDYGHGVRGLRIGDMEMLVDAVYHGEPYHNRPHGEWISKPKRVQVDETDEERIFETKLEWFCSFCDKSFGCRKPEDDFCKYCGSDNRPKEGEKK